MSVIVEVRGGESLEKALKVFKRKVMKGGDAEGSTPAQALPLAQHGQATEGHGGTSEARDGEGEGEALEGCMTMKLDKLHVHSQLASW